MIQKAKKAEGDSRQKSKERIKRKVKQKREGYDQCINQEGLYEIRRIEYQNNPQDD